jgi:G3E family GTPase
MGWRPPSSDRVKMSATGSTEPSAWPTPSPIMQNLEEFGEAVKQISFADAILLNKTDLVDEAAVGEAMAAIRQYNPLAPIHPCVQGKVDPALVRGLQAYEKDSVEAEVTRWMRLPASKHDLVAHSFAFDEALDAVKFEHWINMLLFLSGYQIYRVKGILHIAGMCDRVIFQSVRSQFRIERGRPWEEGEDRRSRIVFIGYNVKRPALEKGLDSCKVSD